LVGDGGTAVTSPDQVASPTLAALLDLPSLNVASNQPQMHLAATSSGLEWKPVNFEVAAGGISFAVASAARPSLLGKALNPIGAGEPFLLDLLGTVDVQLSNAGAWLMSCDDDALAVGENLAALGSELIQFGSAEALGAGRFRLSRLLRGRRGTEWATGSHQAGEVFVLLTPGTFRTVELPLTAVGTPVRALPKGLADDMAQPIEGLFIAEGLRPPSPVHLKVARDEDGGLQLGWARRSRSGWEWRDEIDVPLGETRELYRIKVEGSSARIVMESAVASLTIPASALAAIGPGAASIHVCQIGDYALSRPATADIVLP
jgi:hypothetical protein